MRTYPFSLFVLAFWLLASCGGGGGGTESNPPPVAMDNRPTVSWQGPADNSVVSGTVTLAVNASDDNGVSGVEFLVDGSSIGTDQTAPYELVWDTTRLTEGAHTIRVVATDTANRTAESQITVILDNVAPEVRYLKPNMYPLAGEVVFAVDAIDIASGELGIATGPFTEIQICALSPETLECTFDSTRVADGNYGVCVQFVDDANNNANLCITVNIQNDVTCLDKSENGICDDEDPRPTVTEFHTTADALWADNVNADYSVCAYLNSSQAYELRVTYSPDYVGSSTFPKETLALNDEGINGDAVAGDNYHCATVNSSFPEPDTYRFADGAFDIIVFDFSVYDANGVGLGQFEWANSYSPNPQVRLMVTNPSARVPVTMHSATVARTSHIVNIVDGTYNDCLDFWSTERLTNTLYDLSTSEPDPYDQIALFLSGKSYRWNSPSFSIVKDDISHNSTSDFDMTAWYGSAGRLRNVSCMSTHIEGSALTHEFAHAYGWLSDLMDPGWRPMMDGGWHYFQSDDPGPLTSKGELVNIAPGIYRAQNVDGGSSENYLPWSRTTLRTMSLLCEENYGEVRFANRMLNENEEVPENETTLHNNASREAINSVMNPNCVESQKDFRVALILVTRDGYANDALMSGLHALALYHEGEHIGVPTTDMPGYTAQIISGSLRYASRNTATFRLDIPPFD